MFKRARLEPLNLYENVPKSSFDHMTQDGERSFMRELMNKDPKKYCEYCVYKIFHFVGIFYKITLHNFVCDFLENQAADYEFCSATIYDADSKHSNFYFIARSKEEYASMEQKMAYRIENLLEKEKEAEIERRNREFEEMASKKPEICKILDGKRRMFNRMKTNFVKQISGMKRSMGYAEQIEELLHRTDKDFKRVRPDFKGDLREIIQTGNYDYNWLKNKSLNPGGVINSLDPDLSDGNKKSWIGKVEKSIAIKRRKLKCANVRRKAKSKSFRNPESTKEKLKKEAEAVFSDVADEYEKITVSSNDKGRRTTIMNTPERKRITQQIANKKAMRTLYKVFSRSVRHKLKKGSKEDLYISSKTVTRESESLNNEGRGGQKLARKIEQMTKKELIADLYKSQTFNYPQRENAFIPREQSQRENYMKKFQRVGRMLRRNELLNQMSKVQSVKSGRRKKKSIRRGKSFRTRTFLDEIVKSNIRSQMKREKIMRINQRIAKRLRTKISKNMPYYNIQNSKSLDTNPNDIKQLERLELIPTIYLRKKLRMKQIGLSSSKWNWKPKQLETFCFDLVDVKDVKEEKIMKLGETHNSRFKNHQRHESADIMRLSENLLGSKSYGLGSTTLALAKDKFSSTAYDSNGASRAVFRTNGSTQPGTATLNTNNTLRAKFKSKENTTLNGFNILGENDIQKIFSNDNEQKIYMDERVNASRASNLHRQTKIPGVLEIGKSKKGKGIGMDLSLSKIVDDEILMKVMDPEERQILNNSLNKKKDCDLFKPKFEGKVMRELQIADIEIGIGKEKVTSAKGFDINDYKSLKDRELEVN